jgi:hypothetical protein
VLRHFVILYAFTWWHRPVMNCAVIMFYNELNASGYCGTSRRYVCSFFHACVKWPEGPQKHPDEHPEGPHVGHWAGIPWKKPIRKVPEPSDVFQTIQK